MLQNLIESNANLFTFLGFVFGLISLIIAYLFYLKSKRVIKLTAHIYTYPLSEKGVKLYDNLDVFYKNQRIDFFCVSKLYIANEGTEEITGDKISKENPLIITSEDNEEILDYELFDFSNPASKIKIIPKGNSNIVLEFDYLNPGDEFYINIIHNSPSEVLKVSGSIIGQKQVISEKSKTIARKTVSEIFGQQALVFFKYKKLPYIIGIARITLGIGLIALVFFKNYSFLIRGILGCWGSIWIYNGFREIIFFNKFSRRKGRFRFMLSKPFLPKFNKEVEKIFEK